MSAPLIVPSVHLNGTSREELTEQLEAAAAAVQEAIGALRRAAPNGRDYYPQGPQMIGRAIEQHTVRMDHLRTVLRELTEIFEAVQS